MTIKASLKQIILLGMVLVFLFWGSIFLLIGSVFLFFGYTTTRPPSNLTTIPIASDAFIYILNIGISENTIQYKGLRNGFAVGDGQYILTAAHCVADFDNTNQILCQPMVISPYFGDIFEAEIVAVDKKNDIAILKVAWDAHPALELETSENWKKKKTITITGYPPIDEEKGGDGKHNSWNIKSERVGIAKLDGEGNQATTVGPVKYVGEGWSGSAFISAETGKVAGITCTKFSNRKVVKMKLFLNFKIPLPEKWYITGCDLSSIQSLFQKHQLNYGTLQISFPHLNRKYRFDKILSVLDTIKPDNEEQITAYFQELQIELPNSYLPMIVMTAGQDYPGIVSNMEKAIEIAPDSSFVHAAYGNYLMTQNKLTRAAEQFRFVTERDPNHIFACHGLLSTLVKTDPDAAVVFGRELIQRWPENAGFCFEYSKALRANNRRKEELPVIQKAIELCEEGQVPFQYQRYLADSLKANNYYEQAEQAYKKLLTTHECEHCWWAYTILLLDMGPEKVEQAQQAHNKTLAFIQDSNEILNKQHFYEETLEKMFCDPNVVSALNH